MDKIPFLPSLCPSNFNKPASFFITFIFSCLAISSSLEMMTEAGFLEVNLASLASESSSNNPDRSNPAEREIISKAFKLGGLGDSCFELLLILLLPEEPEASISEELASLLSLSGITCLELNPFRNQELSLILDMEALVLGFGSIILDSSLRTSGGNQLGHLYSDLPIFLYISIKFELWNGR